MIDIVVFVARAWLGAQTAVAAPSSSRFDVEQIPLIATPLPGVASKASYNANTVVADVQRFYAGVKQVSARFRQTVTNTTFGSSKASSGSVYLLKPGKMRWDYVQLRKGKTAQKKSFISNGSYLYVVEHDNKQVVKKNLQNDLMPVAVTFLFGTGDLTKEFNAAIVTKGKYGTKDDIVLEMTPKKPSAQYKNLYLVVSKDNYRVKQSVIIDSSNNTNNFEFFLPDFEKPIKQSWFEFDERSVKNYRIVDADQSLQQGSASAPSAPPK